MTRRDRKAWSEQPNFCCRVLSLPVREMPKGMLVVNKTCGTYESKNGEVRTETPPWKEPESSYPVPNSPPEVHAATQVRVSDPPRANSVPSLEKWREGDRTVAASSLSFRHSMASEGAEMLLEKRRAWLEVSCVKRQAQACLQERIGESDGDR